uniref:EF-hand domain-containing protein n=1 Tax=Electrophorus electricus TaxID=8005 RepID=A0AAY5ETW8_ELEEL
MSKNAHQAPRLNLAELTAKQFTDIWNHFDSDGNGYIEGKELENFFRELETARKGLNAGPANAAFRQKIQELMHKFDQNADGRIEMSELAQILPTEENFLLFFRQFVGSSVEFMVAWRKYDTHRSGYIESNELKSFLSDLLKKANRHYEDKKLNEYTQTILKMFDLNGDGKLGLSEMARLLPMQENFLLKFQGYIVVSHQDSNGYIDENELDALLRDLYQNVEENYKEGDKNLASSKNCIMALSDRGKLFRTELEILLCKEPFL